MKNYITADPHIKFKDVSEIVKKPIVVRVNKFDEEAAEKFDEQISEAHTTNQSIIPVVIDSYGGQVYSLLSMIGTIQSAELPIATIAEGKAMSCGAVLLSFGSEGHRYMARDATILIHDVSSWSYGKVEEIKADAEETERLNQKIYRMMAVNCKKEEEHFLKIVHERGHADWFLDADEASKHNLVNHVRVPSLETKISVTQMFT